MEKPYNQTSAYITPTYTYIPTHTYMSDFENNDNDTEDEDFEGIYLTVDCLSFLAMLLGLCSAVYGLYALIKTGHFSHVFVINLFISDLIQTSARLIQMCKEFLDYDYDSFSDFLGLIYCFGVMANICFMVFISGERYAMTAYPVWYRNIDTIRTPVCVSVTVWIVLSITVITSWFIDYIELFVLLILLLPYPLVMLFFMGTWRALSRNTSLSRHEQRRIMGTLALILSIYTVLFLPFALVLVDFFHPIVDRLWIYLVEFAQILMALNPLSDFLLYLFIRRDAKDILRALFFCSRLRHEDTKATETLMEAHV